MSTAAAKPRARRAAAKAPVPVCKHCGVPSPSGDFCCSGCAYVYRMIHDAGLDAYYRIKDEVTAPADAALLPARDHAWLADAQREAEQLAGDKTAELLLDVQGISCAGCVWLIEKVHSRQPGAGRADINAQTGQMRLAWSPGGGFDAPAFARALQQFNYLLSPASAERSAPLESRALIRRIGLCAAFAMNVMLFALPVYFGMDEHFAYARLFSTLSMAFATLSLLAGGGYFLGRALGSLREGLMNIDLPIALGIVGAYAGSLYGWAMAVERYIYFDFVATFILLMLVGRWAQLVAVERNQRRLLAQQPTPPRIRVWADDGTTREIAPETLRAGQRFAVARGQTVPVEARLETAEATFSLAWINGESDPRVFRAGQRVPAGATNVTQAEIRLRSTQAWAESLLAELYKPVARAAYRHRFLENVIRGYLVAVLVIAAASAVGWYWTTGDALRAGAVVTAVLVVSCPCAIGLAFPLADEMSTLALRKRGVFVRATDIWPRLDRVRRLVFDKTGTLTLETPGLTNPDALEKLTPEARAALFALVEDNPHPVGRCLHELLLARGANAPMRIGVGPELAQASASEARASVAGELTETIGYGVTLKTATQTWTLGRPGWSATASIPAAPSNPIGYPIPTPTSENAPLLPSESNLLGYFGPADPGTLSAPQPPNECHLVSDIPSEPGAGAGVQNPSAAGENVQAESGCTELACDGRLLARFQFSEKARLDARDEIAALRRRDLDCVILSGDRAEKVDALTAELGLPAASGLAGLTPHEKAAWVEKHGATDVLMLGDGANDSLAFDRALCRGTPVIHRGMLAQKADFYYLGRGIGGIRALFEVNDARRRTHRWLLVFSVAYNLFAVGLAVAGHMNPLIAAILMPLSSLASLAVVAQGMRPAGDVKTSG